MSAEKSSGDDVQPTAAVPAPATRSRAEHTARAEARERSADDALDGRPRAEGGEASAPAPAASDSNAPAPGPSPDNPPLPDEEAPPLPDEAPPEDDGWDAIFDSYAQAYYFYNRFTHATQWENPRVPAATTHGSYDRYPQSAAPGTTSSSGAPGTSSPPKRLAGGYNPAIHGSYDPNADYAKETEKLEEEEQNAAYAAVAGLADPSQAPYVATGHFNRFTGRFQHEELNPEVHNDENKSRRQMSAFFDVDAAANSHDGRSLKAERRGKTLSKKELKAYKEKRREKKEEKRRAWLRD